MKQVIIRECGGLIGALRQSIDALAERFYEEHLNPPEPAFLSKDLLEKISRCFGSVHSILILNDFKMFLKKNMVDEKQIPNILANQQVIDSF